ncbi:hypothetical protein O1611_g4854 [Lasiodiplodia mahajangana]|uniref:Uncharacterized protein n=1 Tax=Lasiodiplodia mahajangana TaxID=1108764 RepID=A0ACC2JMP7_9PEZI|nr:hypothetical protein O1611_g4854 [Lasiodiplodia mahajangana]
MPHPRAGRAIWVDEEVSDFLYRGGENPFGFDGQAPNYVSPGKGIVRDAFDPSHERPWADFKTYARLGYYAGSPWSLVSS